MVKFVGPCLAPVAVLGHGIKGNFDAYHGRVGRGVQLESIVDRGIVGKGLHAGSAGIELTRKQATDVSGLVVLHESGREARRRITDEGG